MGNFVKEMQDGDVVLGSGYITGINVVNWDFKRLLLSKLASAYVRLVLGMPYTDLTGGFKCWRRTTLEALQLDRIFSMGYLFQVETTYRVWRARRFKSLETPIIFYQRK